MRDKGRRRSGWMLDGVGEGVCGFEEFEGLW